MAESLWFMKHRAQMLLLYVKFCYESVFTCMHAWGTSAISHYSVFIHCFKTTWQVRTNSEFQRIKSYRLQYKQRALNGREPKKKNGQLWGIWCGVNTHHILPLSTSRWRIIYVTDLVKIANHDNNKKRFKFLILVGYVWGSNKEKEGDAVAIPLGPYPSSNPIIW